MISRDDILDILQQNDAWISSVDIHQELVRRSWVGRKFGEPSLIAALFGPSLGRMHVLLWEMEQDGTLTSRWLSGPYPRRRVYRPSSRVSSSGDRSEPTQPLPNH